MSVYYSSMTSFFVTLVKKPSGRSPITLTMYTLQILFIGFSKKFETEGLFVSIIKPSDFMSNLPTLTTRGNF